MIDLDVLATAIAEANGRIASANQRINELKRASAAANVEKLEHELRTLRNRQIRGESAVSTLCDAYAEQARRRDALQKEKAQVRTTLETQSADLLKRYEASLMPTSEDLEPCFALLRSSPHTPEAGPARPTV